jgi:hypothetical protein
LHPIDRQLPGSNDDVWWGHLRGGQLGRHLELDTFKLGAAHCERTVYHGLKGIGNVDSRLIQVEDEIIEMRE